MKRIEKSRLRQLELGGLVDYDPDGEAVFIVVGSTGNHYVLRMDGSKRSCTCMDYRFRRHDCKHIKLILQQLKLQSSSDGDWRQVSMIASSNLDCCTLFNLYVWLSKASASACWSQVCGSN